MRVIILLPLALVLFLVPVVSAGCTTTYEIATHANGAGALATQAALIAGYVPTIPGTLAFAAGTNANAGTLAAAQTADTTAYVACVV